jgi:hypothetical protein
MDMTVTVGPAGVLHPAAAAGAVEPAAAGVDALLALPAADVEGLVLLPVELLELLHAAADSAVTAITANSAGSRLVLIDSPGGLWRERARQPFRRLPTPHRRNFKAAATVRSMPGQREQHSR